MNTQARNDFSQPEPHGVRQRIRAETREHNKNRVRELHPGAAVHPAIKLTRKLEKLSFVKVVSFSQRFARRTSTASHLLEKLHPGSIMRVPLESSVRGNEAAFQQCIAELKARANHCAQANA